MRFTEGDRVHHRGLKFISGIVVKVVRVPDTDPQDDRSYFCKVQLKNGQFYSDRATEWEPSFEASELTAVKSKPDREGQLYVGMG